MGSLLQMLRKIISPAITKGDAETLLPRGGGKDDWGSEEMGGNEKANVGEPIQKVGGTVNGPQEEEEGFAKEKLSE